MNALKASTHVEWKGYRRIVEADREGLMVGWQFVGPSTNRQRFGGSFARAVEKGRAANPVYWEFYAPDLQQVSVPE